MQFDIETDPDTMYELFGEDYLSFAEGPVWVYVLERRKAVEVWNTLMGDVDPDIAREETSNSLRALYGISRERNAVMGAPDVETAEIQIQCIFASSPLFPTSDLPDVGASDSFTLSTDRTGSPHPDGVRQRVDSQKSKSSGRISNASGKQSGSTGSGGEKSKFRARVLPATHDKPDIVPRMSRAASLRAGLVDINAIPKRFPATAESLARTFAGVPGHKRADTIQVASTAPPVVAPRMTRAAALRIGQAVPTAKPKGRPSTAGAAPSSDTFDGVPGHKRRESIAVASTKPPSVAPRTNRSATLRVSKETAPPTSFNFRSPATISRSSSRTSLDLSGPTRPTIVRPASAASLHVNGNGVARPRSSVSRPLNTSSAANKPVTATNGDSGHNQPTTADAKAKPRPSMTQAPPSIAPRTNKSALLRAAKMALTGQSGTTVNGKANGRTPAKKSLAGQTPKPIRA